MSQKSPQNPFLNFPPHLLLYMHTVRSYSTSRKGVRKGKESFFKNKCCDGSTPKGLFFPSLTAVFSLFFLLTVFF